MITPGIYIDLDNLDYHFNAECEALSKGGMDRLLSSPAHFAVQKTSNPSTTKDMCFGSAFHTLILQPDDFEKSVSISTKAGPKDRSDAALNGIDLITQDEYASMLMMRDALMSTATGETIINHPYSKKEVSVFWEDYVWGFLSKCRPDIKNDELNILCDLKTSKGAGPNEFSKSCANYNYDTQAYHYLHGMEVITHERWKDFIFIVCEKTPPYAVSFYRASPEMIDNGRKKAERARHTYAECLKSNIWPGYQDKVFEIDLPRWAILP